MITDCCLYNEVRVKDLECETPSIETIPLVREFPNVFPNDRPRVPAERDIDFCIELLPDTNHI